MIKTLQASTNLAGMAFQFRNIVRYFLGKSAKVYNLLILYVF